MGDERPLSCCRWSPDGGLLAVGAFSGTVRLFDAKTSSRRARLSGHTDRVGGLAWHPTAPDVLASAGADGVAYVWRASVASAAGDPEAPVRPVLALRGHEARLSGCEWHPSGRCVFGSVPLLSLPPLSTDRRVRAAAMTTNQELETLCL